MKIVKKLFFVLMLISSICLISCGGGGSSDNGSSLGGTLYIPAEFKGTWINGANEITFTISSNEILIKIASNPDAILTVIGYQFNSVTGNHQFQIDDATPYWIEMEAPVGGVLSLKAANMHGHIPSDMAFNNDPIIPGFPSSRCGTKTPSNDTWLEIYYFNPDISGAVTIYTDFYKDGVFLANDYINIDANEIPEKVLGSGFAINKITKISIAGVDYNADQLNIRSYVDGSAWLIWDK